MNADASRLPDIRLGGGGPCSRRARALGFETYRTLAHHVAAVPYGRNTDRGDHRLVLEEGCGTCSTKHALLAAVAREEGLDVDLVMAIFLMSARTTPPVGPVLAAHGLTAIPEAHCFLRFAGEIVDLTGVPGAKEDELEYLDERVIEPSDIGAAKVAFHRQAMERWLTSRSPSARRWTLDALWEVREACIAAIAAWSRG